MLRVAANARAWQLAAARSTPFACSAGSRSLSTKEPRTEIDPNLDLYKVFVCVCAVVCVCVCVCVYVDVCEP